MREPEPDHAYRCLRTEAPLVIDGDLSKPPWQGAPKSPRFVDIVDGAAAIWETRAALLWDDEHLYVGFWVTESDLRANVTRRDDFVFLENDVEVFIAGAEGAYYEFQLNAANTCFEALYVWQDAYRKGGVWSTPEWRFEDRDVDVLGGYTDGVRGRVPPFGPRRWAFRDFDVPGLRHQVRIEGTLNDSSDVDRGWTAEIAFPWAGLKWLAGGVEPRPAAGDVWRLHLARYQPLRANGKDFHHSVGMSWRAHGSYDSHMLDRFLNVSLAAESVESGQWASSGRKRLGPAASEVE